MSAGAIAATQEFEKLIKNRFRMKYPAIDLIYSGVFLYVNALTRINMQDEVLRIWQRKKTTMILITHDIDEAIFLSDRILIMGKNPGGIKKEIPVEMSRPRSRNGGDFIRIREVIYKEFFKNTEIELEYYI